MYFKTLYLVYKNIYLSVSFFYKCKLLLLLQNLSDYECKKVKVVLSLATESPPLAFVLIQVKSIYRFGYFFLFAQTLN